MVNLGFPPESVGGSEFYTYYLSKALIQRGHEVTVLAAVRDVTLNPSEVIHTSFENIPIIKIANSPVHARSFADHFLNADIDALFMKIVGETKPDLVHFQHLAYLSARLPETAHRMNVPSILTLHDYWYMCFRSQLLRPGYGICPGPSEGAFCASCNHKSAPNPMAVPRYPLVVKIMNRPEIGQRIASMVGKLPSPFVFQARAWLFKEPSNGAHAITSEPVNLSENKFRYEFFKNQFVFPKFILSPSIYLKQRYENAGFKGITVLPLGYRSADKVERLPFTGKLKIGYLGNIERHKGLLVMLRELATIRDRDELEINIHGRPKDPVYFSEVKKLSKRLLGNRAAFHGSYRSDTDLKAILAEMHLLVFPSLWEENSPLVVREALIHGVPVIASQIGGVSEVIKDGVNGFLFNPYEAGDLSAKISAIMGNPQILESVTEGARNTTVESMEEHAMKICDLYQHALATRGEVEASRGPAL